MDRLQRLTLNGFKSIKALELELNSLNILIGANGAGKSNLISFFKMLNEIMAGRCQQYIGTSGRAQSLLHFGPKITPQIEAKLEFEVENGVDTYCIRLSYAAGDTLIFTEEIISFQQTDWESPRTDSVRGGTQKLKLVKKQRTVIQKLSPSNIYWIDVVFITFTILLLPPMYANLVMLATTDGSCLMLVI